MSTNCAKASDLSTSGRKPERRRGAASHKGILRRRHRNAQTDCDSAGSNDLSFAGHRGPSAKTGRYAPRDRYRQQPGQYRRREGDRAERSYRSCSDHVGFKRRDLRVPQLAGGNLHGKCGKGRIQESRTKRRNGGLESGSGSKGSIGTGFCVCDR